jgi:hypothetical protein
MNQTDMNENALTAPDQRRMFLIGILAKKQGKVFPPHRNAGYSLAASQYKPPILTQTMPVLLG